MAESRGGITRWWQVQEKNYYTFFFAIGHIPFSALSLMALVLPFAGIKFIRIVWESYLYIYKDAWIWLIMLVLSVIIRWLSPRGREILVTFTPFIVVSAILLWKPFIALRPEMLMHNFYLYSGTTAGGAIFCWLMLKTLKAMNFVIPDKVRAP